MYATTLIENTTYSLRPILDVILGFFCADKKTIKWIKKIVNFTKIILLSLILWLNVTFGQLSFTFVSFWYIKFLKFNFGTLCFWKFHFGTFSIFPLTMANTISALNFGIIKMYKSGALKAWPPTSASSLATTSCCHPSKLV